MADVAKDAQSYFYNNPAAGGWALVLLIVAMANLPPDVFVQVAWSLTFILISVSFLSLLLEVVLLLLELAAFVVWRTFRGQEGN